MAAATRYAESRSGDRRGPLSKFCSNLAFRTFSGNLRRVRNLFGRYLLAIVAGLALAASFPKIGFSGLAWIAPALMLIAAAGKKGWEAFRIGYVAGLVHYLASLYW